MKKDSNRKFYIFSDDLKWCRERYTDKKKFQIIEHSYAGKKFKNYLYLMSKFKYFIIPNSTFAWWGAWLSKQRDKIVIAPKRWSGVDPESKIDTPLDDWIRIEN
jgi:hypothetical protein